MIALLFVASALQAPVLIDCTKVEGSQVQLNECAYKSYKQADYLLNEQWHKTAQAARQFDKEMARIRKPAFDHLLKGQRAWLTYREETCGWVRDAFGGSIAPMNYYLCMAGVTSSRTQELKMLARDPNSGEPL